MHTAKKETWRTFSHKEAIEAAKTIDDVSCETTGWFVFWLMHHWDLYKYYRMFAQQAYESGRPRFSVYMIRERVRWYVNVEQRGDYKIPNNSTPFMARLLCMENPCLRDIFRMF